MTTSRARKRTPLPEAIELYNIAQDPYEKNDLAAASLRSPGFALIVASILASIAPQAVAADWADPAKVLRIAFPTDVSGLDPAGTQETYTAGVEARIFDALYRWDYLE